MKKFRFVKYFIIIFIIIAIYSGNAVKIKDLATKASMTVKSFTNPPITPEPQNNPTPETSNTDAVPFKVAAQNNDSMVSNITVNLINKILDNPNGRAIFEEVVNKMVVNYHGAMGDDIIHKEYVVKEVIAGDGKTAMCGDMVTISYTAQLSTAKPDENNAQRELKDIIIGQYAINRGLENGIIGMKENGNRKIVFNDEKLSKQNQEENKNNFFIADVILKKVNKETSQENSWGIFVDKESFSVIGPKILCGDSIDAYYTIRTASGKKLYDSRENKKKINFEIGSTKTPSKISQGLMGLVKNKSKISVILNNQELKYKDKNGQKLAPKNIPTELVIVDIDTRD